MGERSRRAHEEQLASPHLAEELAMGQHVPADQCRCNAEDGVCHEADCFAEAEAVNWSNSSRSISPFASSIRRTVMR
jgi:hypothetical protein